MKMNRTLDMCNWQSLGSICTLYPGLPLIPCLLEGQGWRLGT